MEVKPEQVAFRDHYLEVVDQYLSGFPDIREVAHIAIQIRFYDYIVVLKRGVEELSEFSDIVIATGGGAPCFFDNIELMNSTGTTIYLNIDPAILADRLLHSKTERPLIKGKSKEELTSFIDEMLKKRNPFYSQARFQITEPDIDLDMIQSLVS